MSVMIGIDLGTSNSLIAQFIDGETRLIPNRLGHVLTPSVVSVTEDDSILVGLAARERLRTAPHLTASAFKRFMGTNKVFRLGKRHFRAEELSALVLKSLKADAEDFLQQTVTDVVVTVPAYFNAIQREATKVAAQLAGLNVLRLLNEPTAAGLAYGLQHEPDDTRFLIYDLGGGTFDVSILDYFDDVVQVSASAGDNRLGGEDFVQVLQQWFLRHCQTLNESDKERLQTSGELWQMLESTKRALSEQADAEMSIRLDEQTHSVRISRNDFQDACQDLMGRLKKPLQRALRDARLDAQQIDNIILVGGATRMPIIRQSIVQLFRRLALKSINPDETIARGAAIQAALIARNESLKEVVLTDVMPFSLGTTVAQRVNEQYREGCFFPIIERNMPVPISRVHSFCTLTDNQSVLMIDVRQGESMLSEENLQLGKLEFQIPPKPAGEVSVDVRFSYDINGLLEVDIVNQDFGIQINRMFRENAQSLSEQEIAASRQKLASLKIHPRELQQNIYLIERAKRLYEEYLGDNRYLLQDELARFEQALDTQDELKIHKAQQRMSAFLSRYEDGWIL